MRKRYVLLALWLLAHLGSYSAQAQTTIKKVVLQAFWWDYYNGTYPLKWADYLTELAPRLKGMGIDAVWIPPTPKNGGTNGVGYSPFDHYDLGDKFQKNDTRTRFGTKDEFLRMVAVMHANGIEVIQDIVLNHIDNAGAGNGAGGVDPNSYSVQSGSGYKNFRYACFGTPVPQTGGENASEYLNRRGRWSKNYTNFHPHLGHNSTSGAMAEPMFGADFCFGDDGGGDGYGPSTNATYNPTQNAGYSRDEARKWIVWLKKQTGVDGFRWDAVKHFSYPIQQDLSYNLKYSAAWASAGESMFNVGEYVGGKNDLDGYTTTVNAQNSGSDFLFGTFDFGLREGIYSMSQGNGFFDIGSLPSRQQDQRVAYYAGSNTYVHRTVPFVNNHDTFRPQLNGSGNYIGWNTGSELAPHIDPFNSRLSIAYAVALAMDGSPQIFFEDLFNVSNGQRYAHEATSTTGLPVRSDLENLIWCHQNLDFKKGTYRVRFQAQDHLIIERSARAIIGINDSENAWKEDYVDSDFAPGTVLKDYSGANGNYTYTVPGDRRIRINTPPCNGTAAAGRRGYSVWAPVGQDSDGYQPPLATLTTQEWEMADDLGDLNCNSLGQGGALPSNSTNTRLVGKIYAQAGQPVSYNLFPEATSGNTRSLTIGVYDLRGQLLSSASGTTAATGTYTPTTAGWLALKVRNTTATVAGQRCFVKVSYTAPAAVNTRTAPAPTNQVAIWTSNDASADPTDCRNWENGIEPSASTDVLIPAGTSFAPTLATGTLAARSLTVESGASLTLTTGTTLRVSGNVVAAGTLTGPGTLELNGGSEQTISTGSSAALALNNLTINNAANVRLLSPVSVSGVLAFTTGRLAIDNQNLTLGNAATVTGADASRYVVTPDVAGTGGFVVRSVPGNGAAVTFPVGTMDSFTPLTLANSGTSTTFQVRTFSGLLTNGTSGTPYSRAADFVNRTWEVTPTLATGPVVAMSLHYNAAERNAGFVPSQAKVYRNRGGAGEVWTELGRATVTGSGPFVANYSGISSFSKFALGNSSTPLPVTLTRFKGRRASAGTVRLDWATALEKDNAGFDLEKSADGKEFRRLTTVPARGGNQPTAYTYNDLDAPIAAYYRLRQRDSDGSTSYSPAVFVSATASPYAVLPNPSHGDAVQLVGGPALADNAPLRLTLSSVLGRTLLAPAPAPRAALAEQLGSFLRQATPGVYVVTLTGPDGLPQRLRVVRE